MNVRFDISLNSGSRSGPTTESTSFCALSCTSGCITIARTNVITVKTVVSDTAEQSMSLIVFWVIPARYLRRSGMQFVWCVYCTLHFSVPSYFSPKHLKQVTMGLFPFPVAKSGWKWEEKLKPRTVIRTAISKGPSLISLSWVRSSSASFLNLEPGIHNG